MSPSPPPPGLSSLCLVTRRQFGKLSKVRGAPAFPLWLGFLVVGSSVQVLKEPGEGDFAPWNSQMDYVQGGLPLPGGRCQKPGARWDSASCLWAGTAPHCHPASLALPFPHPSVFPETHSTRGLSHHNSPNSGEVSKPPRAQLPAPPRTAGTGSLSSQQPRPRSRNHEGYRLPRDLFLLSCQGFGGGVFQNSDCLCFVTFSGVFLKWLFVILPPLTHLSQ